MKLKIKEITGTQWQSYDIQRFSLDEFLSCNLYGGYRSDTPKRDQLYVVNIIDEATCKKIEKIGIYTNYNFVADKNDNGNIVVYDNSLNFQIVG